MTRGSVEVRAGFRVLRLAPGEVLTFGRSTTCDLVLAGDPEDLLVSRQAGRLTGVERGALVTNTSSRHPIVLQAVPGPEFEIGPGMTVGTMPHARTRVVVLGQHAARYLIYLDARGLLEPGLVPGAPPEREAPGAPTTSAYRRMDLTRAQRRYLAALCEPCLVRVGGRSAPASYAAIAERCDVSPRTVRNCLDQVRQMLSSRFGVPGLVGAEGDPAAANYAAVLARWAIDSENVTLADLEAIDP